MAVLVFVGIIAIVLAPFLAWWFRWAGYGFDDFFRSKKFRAEKAFEAADAKWTAEAHDLRELLTFAQTVSSVGGGETGRTKYPFLQPNESVVAALEGVRLVEMRRQPGEYRGDTSGFSVRLAKGVSYQVGSSRGSFRPGSNALSFVDRGQIFITNQRAL